MNIAIKAIYISSGHDFVGRHGKGRLDHGIEKVDTVECLAGRGIVNDRYLDHEEDFKGQITFFDWDVYDRIRTQCNLPDLDPALFRRNVLTSGVDLNTLIGLRDRPRSRRLFERPRRPARTNIERRRVAG